MKKKGEEIRYRSEPPGLPGRGCLFDKEMCSAIVVGVAGPHISHLILCHALVKIKTGVRKKSHVRG